MPPTGALNIPAIPAPAPQPIIIIISRGGSPTHRPNWLAKAAPADAIGPSAPAEPPNPKVRVDAIIGPYVYVDGISYCLSFTILPILLSPCSIFRLKPYRCRATVSTIPASGITSRAQFTSSALKCDTNNTDIHFMVDLSMNAHPPVISPTRDASTYNDTDGGNEPNRHSFWAVTKGGSTGGTFDVEESWGGGVFCEDIGDMWENVYYILTHFIVH